MAWTLWSVSSWEATLIKALVWGIDMHTKPAILFIFQRFKHGIFDRHSMGEQWSLYHRRQKAIIHVARVNLNKNTQTLLHNTTARNYVDDALGNYREIDTLGRIFNLGPMRVKRLLTKQRPRGGQQHTGVSAALSQGRLWSFSVVLTELIVLTMDLKTFYRYFSSWNVLIASFFSLF